MVEQVEDGPLVLEHGQREKSGVEVRESKGLGGIALDELSLYEVGGMVDVGRDSGGGWAVEGLLAADGIGLIGKAVSYLSMIDLTISKQVS